MKRILLFLLLICGGNALADEPRENFHFESNNGKFELKIVDSTIHYVYSRSAKPSHWNLVEKATNRIVYTMKGEFASKNAFISNDGNHVVVVDDWSMYPITKSLPLLEFYKEGELIRKYTMGELLCSVYSITSSSSHFWWFDAGVFLPEHQTYSFTTFELNRYLFDITTGNIVSKTLHPSVNRQSLLVYGEIRKTNKNTYEMEVCHRVYGEVPETGKVQFFCKQLDKFNHYQTVLINNGKYTDTGYNLKGWFLNQCHYLEEKELSKEQFEKEYKERKNDCL